ncbi:MAG: hypothetical protein BECKG1743F_GA0114225_102761, partial [Candidatus Kentron sp. G]
MTQTCCTDVDSGYFLTNFGLNRTFGV